MKNVFLLFTTFLLYISCKENNIKTNKMSNLTSKNYIETMMNSTKHYDYEPMYYLTYVQNVCYSEILVNDIPVNKNFKEIGDGGTIPINNYIFRSGVQKVTFRLYPATKGKDFDFEKFTFGTDMNIEISESDNKKRDIDGKEIVLYTTPITKYINSDGYERTQFEGTGKIYYEASFTFEAKVPYEFNNLDKAQDLSKWKKDILQEKVVDFYKNQWNLIDEKRTDEYFSYLDLKEKQTCQSEFSTRTEIEENLETYLLPFVNTTFKLEPLENYIVKLYGGGRIVCLELKSLEPKMRGKSALWGRYKDGETSLMKYRKYYLYIPEGDDEFKILR